jgi:curved DNA-binding protein CbpA
VLWEGVRKPFPEDRLRSTLDPHSEVPLYPRRDLLDLASEVPLESEDVRLLRTVRRLHGHPLGHVLSEIGDERGIRFLYYLLLQGYLSLGGSNDGDPSTRKLTPDTAARIRSARRRLDSLRRRNHFQVLEVPLDGDDARVHQAYLRKAKDVHPDTLGPHEPAGLRQVYNDTFQRIRASYEAIKTENGRREHLRSLEGKVEKKPVTDKAEIMEAEVCFQEGKVLLKQRKWDAAAEAFEKALSLNPEEAEYTLGLGSARVHQAAAGRRDLLSEAEDLLEKARGSMPGSPEPCYQLGRLESLRGGLESAASHFENALQHDPNHWLAMRELRVMNMRTRDKSNRQFGRV